MNIVHIIFLTFFWFEDSGNGLLFIDFSEFSKQMHLGHIPDVYLVGVCFSLRRVNFIRGTGHHHILVQLAGYEELSKPVRMLADYSVPVDLDIMI